MSGKLARLVSLLKVIVRVSLTLKSLLIFGGSDGSLALISKISILHTPHSPTRTGLVAVLGAHAGGLFRKSPLAFTF